MINNKMKKYIMIFALIFVFNSSVYADSSTVVTLGKDLNEEQKKQMLEIFNVKEDTTTIIEVNNEEERMYLEGLASEEQLGNITLSSAYVELLEEGSGINVETYNISWVTKEMFQSALVTAGVKDAKIIAAAPFSVSGTGALTGILKAFEEITGTAINEDQKKVANEEIVRLGELGQAIGQGKASELIRQVKEEIIVMEVNDPEEIKKIITDVSKSLDINLNLDQIDDINNLMQKISKLDINAEEIKNQLIDIGEKLDKVLKKNEEVKSLLGKILDAIVTFFSNLFS